MAAAKTISVRWLAVAGVFLFVTPPLTVWAAVSRADANAERLLADQQRAQAQSQVEARRITCSFFAASLDVYDETPPESDAGRNLRSKYLELYRISGCQPARK